MGKPRAIDPNSNIFHREPPKGPPPKPTPSRPKASSKKGNRSEELRAKDLGLKDLRDPKKKQAFRTPRPKFKYPLITVPRKAKRNADAFTAFKVTGAVSTALFLGCGAGAVYSGVQYAKFLGMEEALNTADAGADTFFDESGKLTKESRTLSKSIPNLYPLLQKVESKMQKEDKTLNEAIDEIGEGVHGKRRHWKKIAVGTGVAAGAGLVGMIIFLTAASIAKHRGNMLYRRDRISKFKPKVTPKLSPQESGIQVELNF